MVPDLSQPQIIGLSFVALGALLGAGWVLRRSVRPLGALYLPVSVVTGFLVLLVGPQVLGSLTGTQGLIPGAFLDVWRVMPGLLINVVFAAIMIGKVLPRWGELWDAAAPHAIFGSLLSFGQLFLGGLAVLVLLGPVFGVAPEAGSLLEMSFAGGHGTIAGMGQLLADAGAEDLVDVGLSLATISMITGIVCGSVLVRWAVRSPRLAVARDQVHVPSLEDDPEVDIVRLSPVDEDQDNDHGMHATTFAGMLILLAIAVAVVMLWTARWVAGQLGSDILDSFPLFPVTVIGGFVVQTVATRLGFAERIDKRVVAGMSSVALDGLVVCAIGTMSLATLGDNVPVIVVMTVLGVGWSVVALVWLGPRIHRKDWFEHAIADFGQSQGNVATGFVLAEMVDPARRTTTANDYGYKQLPYEPLLGGGILTALSVPLITVWGLLPFTVVSGLVAVALGVWGCVRRRG
ncbi:Na+/glutamate symporter [Sanguibacter keddieii DSM 10542]|uniref:Na+/glutamate symporter n=1 Tax=Sanguibacter keddieii (strain ATCC 51767 / DSM 10542 / NCFB 3025 / ST-74) TaxID=446469 RepID=D1BJ00_SANKS|nr:sodium:glutamate symporter [Sanguibacter keddieii]ACZ20192.1 Na+/glutamate symporter [Sanguibacter keddieii DSM 10542]